MPLPVNLIDNFTEREGELVTHYIGLKCFCIGSDGQPDPLCKVHELGGTMFKGPRQITGLVTGIEYRKELMQTGAFMPGDVLFSPTSGEEVSEGDKIVFSWALPYGPGDSLIRGAADETDSLYYQAESAIFCVDEQGIAYTEGVDFRFQGKFIEWDWPEKTGAAPEEGSRYSIKYRAFIEWIAFAPPVPRISHGNNVADKVMLRKKHLVER